MRLKILLIFIIIIFYADHAAWAAAAQMIQQQKRVQATMIEQAAVEQAMAEQAMIEQAMIEKAVVERQIAEQVTKRAINQALQEGIPMDQSISITTTFDDPEEETGPQYIADMTDVLKSLEVSSRTWALIIDKEPKAMIIAKYINDFKDQGVTIRKPAADYVDILDGMATQDPEMLKNPLKSVFQLAAILEYDFDNGQDQDAMILNLIGKEAYQSNKERLGLE